MKTKLIWVLCSVALVGVLGGVLGRSVLAAVTEAPAPQVQATPPLAVAPVQPGKPAWLTPEKEAALVEVRKILKEAWETATSIVPPSKPPGTTAPENRLTQLEQYKNKLLRDIEEARFRAGDFTTAVTSQQHWYLTLAQIRYGHLQDAVQTAKEGRFISIPETLVILKLLSDAGDLAGAKEVVQARVAKEPVDAKRRQAQAELLAYLARRQAQAGESTARETLRRAIEATQANYPTYQYPSWVAIGCAQATMGDRNASAESFQRAIQVIGAMKREEYQGHKVSALGLVGRAAGMSSLRAVSQEAFLESLRWAKEITEYRAHVDAIANTAVVQIRSGDRAGGLQTFQEALMFAESLSSNQERRTALGDIVERQLEIGEREAAAATLDQIRQRAERQTDPKERQTDLATIRWGEVKIETLPTVLQRAYGIQDDHEKHANALAYAAERLVHSKESLSTPDILQRLSQTAEALLAKPLPDDRKRADRYLSSLARVQAVAGSAPAALKIVDRITDHKSKRETYLGLVFLLTQKRDVVGAKQVLEILKVKDEEMPWGGSGMTRGNAFRELAKAQVATGDLSGALAWGRQQQSLYAKVDGLLGIALEILDQQRVDDLYHRLPTIGTGRIDKLAIECAAV